MSNVNFQGISDLLWSSYASLQVGEAMGDSEWAPWVLYALGMGANYLLDYMSDWRANLPTTKNIKGINLNENRNLKNLLKKQDSSNSSPLSSMEWFDDVLANLWDTLHNLNPATDLSPVTNPSLEQLAARNTSRFNRLLTLQLIQTAFSDTAPITSKLEAKWNLLHPDLPAISLDKPIQLDTSAPTFQELRLQNTTSTGNTGNTGNSSPAKTNKFSNMFSKLNMMSSAGGAAAGMLGSYAGLKLGSAVFGNSKSGLIATGAVSSVLGLAAGSVGSTVAGNLAHGASTFTGVGTNLGSLASNAAGLTSLGAGVANIAIDVIDPAKKAKWENWVNAGLGLASLATPWTAVAALAFNAIGHGFGSKTENFTADRDMLAMGGKSYGGTTLDALEAESLAGIKHTLWDTHGREVDDRKISEAKRQTSIMGDIVKHNLFRNDLAVNTTSINSTNNLTEKDGGYDQRYSLRAKNGAKLDFIRARAICAKKTADINKFAKGGEIKPKFNEEEARAYIYNRFPILKNIIFELYNDDTFLPNNDLNSNEFGNIEYWLAQHDTLPYYNNRQKPEKYKGKSVIIFNNKATYEDMALDALSHGLREQDPKYQALFEELMDDSDFRYIAEDQALKDNYPNPEDWRKLSKDKLQEFLNNFRLSEGYAPSIDSLVRAMLVKPEERESSGYGYSDEELNKMSNSPAWKKLLAYINGEVEKHQEGGIINLIDPSILEDDPELFKEGGSIQLINPEEVGEDEDDIEAFLNGGSINIIPEGALHAHKHHMEDDENITKKGIPVVDNDGELQAEIEREEIIFRLEVTLKLEELLKIYNKEESSNKEKEQAALEAGLLLVKEILHNTIDNTNNLL